MGEDEEQKLQSKLQARQKLLKEKRMNKELRKKFMGEEYADEVSSSDDSLDEDDPEIKKIIKFEDCLKKRVFLADRVERIERSLVNLGLITKEIHFCSDFEF